MTVVERVKRWRDRLSPPGAGLQATRVRVAERYLKGEGLEFGALHSPLPAPRGVTVKYADVAPADMLQAAFTDVGPIRPPDIIADLESMDGIDDSSQDFVIANHVLEHVEDPLRALGSIGRILRNAGVAFIALPDKRFTFDHARTITSLDHVIKDHAEGPDRTLAQHYDEWCRCIDGLTGEAHAEKFALMMRQRSNIHFHVWDYPAMMELFGYVAKLENPALDVELSMLNEIEVIWVLRKRH